jgi:hypothetical protein
MRNVDIGAYSAKTPSRIKPEPVNLGDLPPITKPSKPSSISDTSSKLKQDNEKPTSQKTASLKKAQRHKQNKKVKVRTGERVNARAPEQVNSRTPERAHTRTPEQVNTRTGERPILRCSFNLFEDQFKTLKQARNQAEMDGRNMNLSEMARQAFDQYLKNLEEQESEEVNG